MLKWFSEGLRLLAIVAVLLGAGMLVPALGQDQMILGPRQFERDNSGKGAVLCVWSVYLSIQTQTADCGWVRRPIDDAIDQAITEIDEFILANSSLHPTRPMLDDFKRRAAELARRVGARAHYCENHDADLIRTQAPDRIQEGVEALLSIPREPVMNPCL